MLYYYYNVSSSRSNSGAEPVPTGPQGRGTIAGPKGASYSQKFIFYFFAFVNEREHFLVDFQ